MDKVKKNQDKIVSEKKVIELSDDELDTVTGGKKVQFEKVDLTCECPGCHTWVALRQRGDGSFECPLCHIISLN